MREYEIYLPTKQADGRDIRDADLQEIKTKLSHAFGGYTQVTQCCEGAWKIDGVTFRDEISIIRVLDNGGSNLDMTKFRRTLERTLNQERLLIIEREVNIL